MSTDVSRLLSALDAQSFPYREFKDTDARVFTFPLTDYIADIVVAKKTYEHENAAGRTESEAPNPLLQRGRKHRSEDRVDKDRNQVSVKDFLSSLRGSQS